MILRNIKYVALAAASFVVAAAFGPAPAKAAIFTPYEISSGLSINQAWGGSFGQDFDVNTAITVTSFGVWVPEGSPNTLTVSIYDRDTQTVVGSPYQFSGPVDAVLTGNNVKFGDPVSIYLAPGHYSLVNDGFGVIGLYNTMGGGLAGTLDDGGGALTFGGWRYSDAANVYPLITASSLCCGDDSPFRFAASTFTAAVPEPSTWAMLILGFAGVGVMTYRRRNGMALSPA